MLNLAHPSRIIIANYTSILLMFLLSFLEMKKNQSSQDQLERIDRITTAIAALEQQKQRLETEGEVAPVGCVVSRYQVRQQQKIYW